MTTNAKKAFDLEQNSGTFAYRFLLNAKSKIKPILTLKCFSQKYQYY